MEQKIPRQIPVDDVDREQYLERSFYLVARVRSAREEAQREMEAFGNVSEYEIRKIYGQRTDIRYDDVGGKEDEANPSPHESRDAAAHERHTSEVASDDRRQSTFNFTAEGNENDPRREVE
jgi:hypothetical protein